MVAVNYRSSEAQALEVVDAITSGGGRAAAIGGDVSDYEQAQAAVAQTVADLGGLHIVVNNAGIAKDALIYNMAPTEWLDVMKVNFGGTFNCTKAALEPFMSQREGVIVNISSVMGERGWTGESNYAASKGAINAFTRCCAVELARFGIRVNAVLPGFAPTDMVAGLMEKDGGKGIIQADPAQAVRDRGRGGEHGRLPGRSRCQSHDGRAAGRRRRGVGAGRGRQAALEDLNRYDMQINRRDRPREGK